MYTPYNPTGQTGYEQEQPSHTPQMTGHTGHLNQSGQPVSIFNPVSETGHKPVSAPVQPGVMPTMTSSAPPRPDFMQSSPLPTWNDPPSFNPSKQKVCVCV